MRVCVCVCFVSYQQLGGEVGVLSDVAFCSLFPLQQITSRIDHCVNYFFRVDDQYVECKEQETTIT